MAGTHKSISINTDELQELLICDICAEPYDNRTRQARFLDCHHTFCSQCLVLLARKGQNNTNMVQCPNCRQPTFLPANGVHGLPTNFFIEKFKAISATADKMEAGPSTEGCPNHHNQTIYFFCETCCTAICRDCTVVDHDKTAGHSIINITDAVVSKRYLLQRRMNASRAIKARIKRDIRQVETGVEKLNFCRDAVIKDVRSIIQDVHKQLDQGEQVVINVIQQQCEFQQSTLLDKQIQFQLVDELLDKHIGESEKLVKGSEINEMISVAETLTKTASIAQVDSDTSKNYLPTDMVTETTSLNDSLCDLGKKCFKAFLPTKVDLEYKKFTAGLESTLTIRPLNDEGSKVPIAACFLSIKITDSWKNTLPVTLNSTNPDCTVAFTPQKSGRHDISVKYCGQKLKCRPTHISVESNDPVLTIGGPGDGNGTFNSPRGITVDNNNCLYVADTGNGLIQKFSAEGEFLYQFQVNRLDKNYTAFTVAFDLSRGLILCTEMLIEHNAAVKGNTILQFSLEGELQKTYTLSGVACPPGIAVTNHSNVFLSDEQERCVFEVDGEGKILRRMGQFGRPGYICCDDNDNIIVPDVFKDSIYIFNQDGMVKHQFGYRSTGKGQIKHPFGVATDGENILVAEGGNDRVQVFKYDGTPVCVIESEGDPLENPRGLAVTEDGHVYVVDRENHCIKKYKYRDMS